MSIIHNYIEKDFVLFRAIIFGHKSFFKTAHIGMSAALNEYIQKG